MCVLTVLLAWYSCMSLECSCSEREGPCAVLSMSHGQSLECHVQTSGHTTCAALGAAHTSMGSSFPWPNAIRKWVHAVRCVEHQSTSSGVCKYTLYAGAITVFTYVHDLYCVGFNLVLNCCVPCVSFTLSDVVWCGVQLLRHAIGRRHRPFVHFTDLCPVRGDPDSGHAAVPRLWRCR